MGKAWKAYRDPELITGRGSEDRKRRAYQAQEDVQFNAQYQCCTTNLEWTFHLSDVVTCDQAGYDPASAEGLTFIFRLVGRDFEGTSIVEHTGRDTACGKMRNRKIVPFMCMYGVNNTGAMNFGKTQTVKRSEPVEGVPGEKLLETSNFGPYPTRETVDRGCPGWKSGVLYAGSVLT